MKRSERIDPAKTWPSSEWPEGVSPAKWAKENIAVVRFPDHDTYASRLTDEILRRTADAANAQHYPSSLGIGSTKIYDIQKWGFDAADLVDERARALFGTIVQSRVVTTDLCWASVYKAGDWVAPHSHPHTLASVLYFLDLGDDDDPLNGRFSFADPRLNVCCQKEAGYMTHMSAPDLTPGTMICFPGKAVHFVSPYHGARPRITISWNLNLEEKSGSALPDWVCRPN